MSRRQFIALLGGAAALPFAALAQSEHMRRVGVLMAYAEGDREGSAFVAAFQEELQKLGCTEGRNIRIDTRWGAIDPGSRQRIAKAFSACTDLL